jgi:hypothetical protein
MRIARILVFIMAAVGLVAVAQPAQASVSPANCWWETSSMERCNRGYQFQTPSVPLGNGKYHSKIEAVVSFPKTSGYRGTTYLSGTAQVYTDASCPGRKFDVRHEFKVNGATGSVSWQGAGINVGPGDQSALIVVTTSGQNWNIGFVASYPISVTHTYSATITCNGRSGITGGSETIALRA